MTKLNNSTTVSNAHEELETSLNKIISKLLRYGSYEEITNCLDDALYSVLFDPKDLNDSQKNSVSMFHRNVSSTIFFFYSPGGPLSNLISNDSKLWDDINFQDGKNMYTEGLEILHASLFVSEYLDGYGADLRAKTRNLFTDLKELVCLLHSATQKKNGDGLMDLRD